MRYVLTVTVPNARTFDAYYYGVGTVLSAEEIRDASKVDDPDDWAHWPIRYTVDYGDDQYRAQYQADRFASGLHFAKVEEVN